jgi:ribulose-phosphate 3-epimerase
VHHRRVQVVASVLAADWSRLGEELEALEQAGVDRVQWDVMDGHFVPNLTVGPAVVAACRPATALPFEAHLMVEHPERLVGPFVAAGCGWVIVHAEATARLHGVLAAVRAEGARPGVALSPATPLEAVRHVVDLVDLVLVMTVEPGFGGQHYLPAMEAKVSEARRLLEDVGSAAELEVDGGIGPTTAPGAVRAGADVLVAGSALFGHRAGLEAAVAELRAGAEAEEALAPWGGA